MYYTKKRLKWVGVWFAEAAFTYEHVFPNCFCLQKANSHPGLRSKDHQASFRVPKTWYHRFIDPTALRLDRPRSITGSCVGSSQQQLGSNSNSARMLILRFISSTMLARVCMLRCCPARTHATRHTPLASPSSSSNHPYLRIAQARPSSDQSIDRSIDPALLHPFISRSLA
jgi:hypothetical protein